MQESKFKIEVTTWCCQKIIVLDMDHRMKAWAKFSPALSRWNIYTAQREESRHRIIYSLCTLWQEIEYVLTVLSLKLLIAIRDKNTVWNENFTPLSTVVENLQLT